MIYELKGLLARVIDFFDPDDYTYVVSQDIDPDSINRNVRVHIYTLLSK
jgi:hypothetical protein